MEHSFTDTEFGRFIEALQYAAKQHRGQRRKGSLQPPYINHPIEVTTILWQVGQVRDMDTLLAALLHDTVEDTGTKPEEISKCFGDTVRDLVMELTDDKTLPKEERKRLQIVNAPHKSPRARQIKLADKISNVREITIDPPADWSRERLVAYLDWAEQVINGLRGQNPALEARFDEVLAEGRKRWNNPNLDR